MVLPDRPRRYVSANQKYFMKVRVNTNITYHFGFTVLIKSDFVGF